MRRERAFTLYEALLTCLLTLVVLGILAGLLKTYSQAVRSQASKARWLQAAQLALERMRCELREATQVDAPISGQLSFVKPDPAQPRYSPVPPAWNPLASSRQCRVRYYLSGERLNREVTLADASRSDHSLLDGVLVFQVTVHPQQLYELMLEVRDQQRSRQLLTRVMRLLP